MVIWINNEDNNERGMEEAERRLKTGTGFIVEAGVLWRLFPARELQPTATHRLGLDIEG
jgi:hypothetical protein